jgi:hypothetical protein
VRYLIRHVRVVVFIRLASACVIAVIRVSRLMLTALESCLISRTACCQISCLYPATVRIMARG